MRNWEWELKKGRLWRAKEILRGHIAQSYRPDEYLTYGKILYEPGDLYEAGKYLFAGGADPDGAFRDAVYIFLHRNDAAHLNEFLSKFPWQFRKTPYENWPSSVKSYLHRRFETGEIERLKAENLQTIPEQTVWEKIKEKLVELFAVAVFIFFIVSLAVGGKTTLEWTFDRLFGRNDPSEKCGEEAEKACEKRLKKCLRQNGERLEEWLKKNGY